MTRAAIYARQLGGDAMQRDLNLVRQILLQLEQTTTTDIGGWPKLDLPGWTAAEISHHVRIMHGEGLIGALDITSQDGDDWRAVGTEWGGHEFLDAARDEGVWTTALARVGGATASVALSAFFELLLETVKEKLGLQR